MSNSSGAPPETVSVSAIQTPCGESNANNMNPGDNIMSKPRTLKKARVDRPPKENVKPRDGDQEGEDRVPKRKIPAQKPVNKPRLKPISWRERKSCSRPR